ncbi:MAG: phage/plasmid primase, P4 family [Actinomycetota bacterium]
MNSLLQLPDVLELLNFTPAEHVSICHQHPGNRFTAHTTAADHASISGLDDANVWFGVNPITPEAGGRGTADQVTRLAALWADLDIKPGGCPNMDTARTITDTLSTMLGARPVALTYSGHGMQPIWSIDPDDPDTNTQTNSTEIRALLRRFGRLVAAVAEKYNARVDSVFDLARVLRAPGSVNHKADPVAVLTLPDTGRPLELAELREALDAYGISTQPEDSEQLGEALTVPAEWAWAPSTCTYTTKTTRAWAAETPDARHPWLLSAAVRLAAMHAHGCINAPDHEHARTQLAAHFEQLTTLAPARKPTPGEIADAFSWGQARVATMPDDRIARELGNHPHITGAAPFGEINSPPAPKTTEYEQPAPAQIGNLAIAPRPVLLDVTQVGAYYGPTEDGTARALTHLHAATLRYCPQRGSWLHWNGHRWEWDTSDYHRELIRTIARNLPAGEGWAAYKRRAMSAAGVTGIARHAQSDRTHVVHIDQLDANPYELNTPGGIINLAAGTLRPADPTALHTRCTTATPDFTTPSPILEHFLADTFGADQKMIDFMARLFGVAAIGTVLEQILPFAHGSGANGKSTLLDAVEHCLGRGENGYAISAPAEMLMARKYQEHPAELAQLAGARLVICSELDEGQHFAEARIKMLTGRDTINARFMRGNPFNFTPSHTFILAGNTKPALSVGGPAFERRIRFLPFDNVVAKNDQDPTLGEKLATAAPAVLAWIVRGAADYLNRGRLDEPAQVLVATHDYMAEQDTLARFVDEACYLQKDLNALMSDVRAAYEHWCSDSGETPVSTTRFGRELRDRFDLVDGPQRNKRKTYQGIGVAGEPVAGDDIDKDWFR